MKLKEHDCLSPMEEYFHMFFQAIMVHKKIFSHSVIGDDSLLFYALSCTIPVLICQAKSMKANETRNLGVYQTYLLY